MVSKWLTYDLESTFLRKGFKRTDTKIIEIALYGKDFNPKTHKGESYQALVNPLDKYSTGEEIIESLESAGQSSVKSINFWVKLLSQKHMIDSSVRRKNTQEKADALAKTLASDEYEFKTTKDALTEAIEFGKEHIWIAHNGLSFDSKIILGNCSEFEIDSDELQFHDSLPMFKHYMKDQPSYSQFILFASMFGDKYKAHHALEDSKALHKMVRKCAENTDKEVIPMFAEMPVKKPRRRHGSGRKMRRDSDLYDISGVGTGSVNVFFDNNIKSKQQLHDYISTNEKSTWLKEFKAVHAYKKLGEKLYSGELILV